MDLLKVNEDSVYPRTAFTVARDESVHFGYRETETPVNAAIYK